MIRSGLELGSGLVRFQSKDSTRAYMEALLEYYKSRLEEYGQQLAELLRSADPPGSPPPFSQPLEETPRKKDKKKDKEASPPMARGWSRVGSIPVNSADTRRATAELTLKIVEDYKSRTEKISEVLKSFNDVDTLSQPGTSSYTVFIYRGVPEAIIVGQLQKKQEVFAFTSSFKAV